MSEQVSVEDIKDIPMFCGFNYDKFLEEIRKDLGFRKLFEI